MVYKTCQNLSPEISQKVDPVVHLLSAFFIIKHSIHLVYLLRCLIQNQQSFRLELIFSELFASIKEQDEELFSIVITELSMTHDPLVSAIILTCEEFQNVLQNTILYSGSKKILGNITVDQLLTLQAPPTFSFTEEALNKLYQPLFEALKTDLSIAVRLLDVKDDNYLVRRLFEFDDTEHQIFSAMGNLISQYEELDLTQRTLADACVEKISHVLGYTKRIARDPKLNALYCN